MIKSYLNLIGSALTAALVTGGSVWLASAHTKGSFTAAASAFVIAFVQQLRNNPLDPPTDVK